MRYLKSFRLFEELDTDAKTDLRMRDNSKSMVEQAKKFESELAKVGVKLISKNTQSSNDTNSLWKESMEKLKSGESKEAYGIMQWSGDICQSFAILSPAEGIPVLQKPYYANMRRINYTEDPDKWCTLQISNSPNEAKSLYMLVDGDVLFDWNDYDKKSKGTLSSKATQLH